MVLVDTTVWIDFFSARSAPHVLSLENLIEQRDDICICGVILTEVLQGIQNDNEFKKTRNMFNNLILLPMPSQTFLRSAEIYRSLRKKGFTIRKPIDCMIASVAIENDIPLLHNDKDFIPIGKHCGLKVHKS
ncbi:MAG: PIN domain nuclease [Deltaproteobacteria bacterium]|nr:PIN domain nuclease [Deltaproteobacteria bacterium]